ncbi:MAG: serine/threonine-protein kinase [Pseudomonadota bacterium]
MNEDQRSKAQALAKEAATLPDADRDAFLDASCGDDGALREAIVEELRQADIRNKLLRTGGGLEIASSLDSGVNEEDLGSQIGPYRLTKRLGTGGFGVVYEAQQNEPVKRQVALKVLKAGMDTESLLARFESERQALAVLEHPNVAKILDAGATPRGRPYFVMELVHGESITDYCDKHGLTVEQRIELLIPVCKAVQHAHQKGIIHRDLKPSNVLVSEADGVATPIVIDFGIAKIKSGDLAEVTLYTREGELVGTPAYMSPEQISGSDVDTRADVYALGVLLYRLLTGRLPFDMETLRQAGFAEVQRRLCEETPPKPSARISQKLDADSDAMTPNPGNPDALSRRIRGELDWIVLKAMEKERGRRYDTALGLGDDLERFLKDLPVDAGPPSARYRLRKFAKRNKLPLALAATVAATVVLALIQTNLQRIRVEQARSELEQVAQFQADMLQRIDAQSLGLWMRDDLRKRIEAVRAADGASEDDIAAVLQQFDEALRRVNFTDAGRAMLDENILAQSFNAIQSEYEDATPVALTLTASIQKTYYEIGLYEEAKTLGNQVLDESMSLFGPDHPNTLEAMNNYGATLLELGEHQDADKFLTETLGKRTELLGPQNPQTLTTLYNLGLNYSGQQMRDEAIGIYDKVLAGRRAVLGNEHEDTMSAMNALGNMLSTVDNDQAEALMLEAIETADRVLGDPNVQATTTRGNLGAHYYKMGRPDESLELFERCLEDSRQLLGSDHSQTQVLISNLGILSLYQRKMDKAEGLIREVFEIRQRMLGPKHPNTLIALNNFAGFYQQTDDFAQAIPLFHEAFAVSEETLGIEHPDTLNTLSNIGFTHIMAGQVEEAGPFLLRARDEANRSLKGRELGVIIGKYGTFLLRAQRLAEAEEELLRAYDILVEAVGEEGRHTQLIIPDLIEVYEGLGNEEALEVWEARRQ